MMKRAVFVISLIVMVLLWGSQTSQVIGRDATGEVSVSIVKLLAADEGEGGRLIPKWIGSGTIISKDGLILTSCHVAFPKAVWDDPKFEYDVLVIFLSTEANEPAQPMYIGEVAQYDVDLDLAVVRISQTLDGTPVDPKELNLPAVSLGDSDKVAVGEVLSIWGYVGISGEAAGSVKVQVSGFSSERGIKGRALIRLDSPLEPPLGGGAAVNEKDELVGVLATGAAGSADDVVHCRYTDDTNKDGTIDLNDICMATGDLISTLRPVNLADALIRAAEQGLRPQPTPTPGPTRKPPAVKASVSRLLFAPDVDEYCQPVTVVESLPSGSDAIYLLFDYENFEDGASWRPYLIINGETYEDYWPVSQWRGGPQGVWCMGVLGDPRVDDGTYEFVINYEGEKLGSATIKVGGPEEAYPTFSHIVLSGGGEEGHLLPGGIKEIEATFEYANMTRDTKWSYVEYYQGEEIARGDGKPFTRPSGTTSLPLSSKTTLEPGVYRLELYIGDRLAATADCVVGHQKGAKEFFGPITFAEGMDRNGNPIRPGTTFQSGIKELHAFFDYQGMEDGWKWTRRWSIDGDVVVVKTETWHSGESGKNFHMSLYNDNGLRSGDYQLELLVEGELVQSGTCTIAGRGPRPTPTPQPPQNGVQIYGHVFDADTYRGIEGAYFVVLQPGIRVAEFDWRASQIYTVARTDRTGYYELPLPLARGEYYGMIVTASGYQPIFEDDVYVDEDLESPLEVDVMLSRVW